MSLQGENENPSPAVLKITQIEACAAKLANSLPFLFVTVSCINIYGVETELWRKRFYFVKCFMIVYEHLYSTPFLLLFSFSLKGYPHIHVSDQEASSGYIWIEYKQLSAVCVWSQCDGFVCLELFGGHLLPVLSIKWLSYRVTLYSDLALFYATSQTSIFFAAKWTVYLDFIVFLYVLL